MALEFNNYHDCILEGYKQSYTHLASFNKDSINKEKLAIRFQCKEIKTEET